jgi:hypothetical protein
MNDPGIDPRLLELLQHASNLQLFQLNCVIERMLADPIEPASTNLNQAA